MRNRNGWAVISRGNICHWIDSKGREQFDIYASEKDAKLSAEEWHKNTGDPVSIIYVKIQKWTR